MKLADFSIGADFIMGGNRWRCTDIGTRTIAAIRLDRYVDCSWGNGPPYAVAEYVIDSDDFEACLPIADVLAAMSK